MWVLPIVPAVPGMISAIQNVQQVEGGWYSWMDLANALFSVSIPEKSQAQFAFRWEGPHFASAVLGGDLSSRLTVTMWSGRIWTLQCSSVIIHDVGDIMVIPETEELARTDFSATRTYVTNQGWLINPAKVQGPAQ